MITLVNKGFVHFPVVALVQVSADYTKLGLVALNMNTYSCQIAVADC